MGVPDNCGGAAAALRAEGPGAHGFQRLDWARFLPETDFLRMGGN